MHSKSTDPNINKIKAHLDRIRFLLSKQESLSVKSQAQIKSILNSNRSEYGFKIQISDQRIVDCTEQFAKLIEYESVQLVKQHYLQLDDLLSCEESEFFNEEIRIFNEIPKMNVLIKSANNIESPFILSAIKSPSNPIIMCSLTKI